MSNSIIDKTVNATKWSTITELVAKSISPITSMILARILAPEAFGVLTTVLMVIAFAEVFVDSGFQKYLIQHAFTSKEEEKRYMSVAFWANLFLGLMLWMLIIAFNKQIADLVGNKGKGNLLIITGIVIPIYSMIGIQNCKLKKELDFRRLFYVRFSSALVPLVITIPLALLGLDYWSLIIGNIMGVVVNSVALFVVKAFKPMLHFSLNELIDMLNYGIWTLMNGIATWSVYWIDAFLLGRFLSDYYLGLYKNSANLVTSIFTIVTASIVPVLFSSLSKLQDNQAMFKKVFLGIQRAVAALLIPMGVGLALYSSFATDILLGAKWIEASEIIGILSLTTAPRTIFVQLNGDVFRAKGHFKTPLGLEILDLLVNVPICYFALRQSFWTFVWVRAVLRLFLILPESYFLWKRCGISCVDVIKGIWKFFLASAVMSGVALVFQKLNDSFLWNVLSVFLCACIYCAVLSIFPKERSVLKEYTARFINMILRGKRNPNNT